MPFDPLEHMRDDEPKPQEQEFPTVPLEVLLTPADKQWLATMHIDCGHLHWFAKR